MGEMRWTGVTEFRHAYKSIAASTILPLSTLIMYNSFASFGKVRKKGVDTLRFVLDVVHLGGDKCFISHHLPLDLAPC